MRLLEKQIFLIENWKAAVGAKLLYGLTSVRTSLPTLSSGEKAISFAFLILEHVLRKRLCKSPKKFSNFPCIFVVTRHLHCNYLNQVQRRTSAVRESLIRETPEDAYSMSSLGVPTEEHRPTLMSLIGLQVQTTLFSTIVSRSKLKDN